MDEITSTQMKKLSIPNAPNKNKKENINKLKKLKLNKNEICHMGTFNWCRTYPLGLKNHPKKSKRGGSNWIPSFFLILSLPLAL